MLFSLFSRHISRTQSFQQNRHINFLALVALKLLVSLISRLVACSPRIVVDTQTHTQTHRTTTVTLAAHARRGLMTFLGWNSNPRHSTLQTGCSTTELPRQLSKLGPNLTSHSTPDEQAYYQLSMTCTLLASFFHLSLKTCTSTPADQAAHTHTCTST